MPGQSVSQTSLSHLTANLPQVSGVQSQLSPVQADGQSASPPSQTGLRLSDRYYTQTPSLPWPSLCLYFGNIRTFSNFAFSAFLREVLTHSAQNGIDPKILATLFCSVFLRVSEGLAAYCDIF